MQSLTCGNIYLVVFTHITLTPAMIITDTFECQAMCFHICYHIEVLYSCKENIIIPIFLKIRNLEGEKLAQDFAVGVKIRTYTRV